jgi:hypothetical protein
MLFPLPYASPRFYITVLVEFFDFEGDLPYDFFKKEERERERERERGEGPKALVSLLIRVLKINPSKTAVVILRDP